MYDPHHVYMDLDDVNNDYNSTSKPQLRFEETRNTPVLQGGSADYFCNIVLFNIQTGNALPVFIPRILTGQNDVNKTIYQVATISDWVEGNTPFPPFGNTGADMIGLANVMYELEDATAQTPAKPTSSQNVSGSYYHVYNYQHFKHLANKANKEKLTRGADLMVLRPSPTAPSENHHTLDRF
jgi:hypothetical protein